MKNLLLSFLLLICYTFINAQSPHIRNSGFEEWGTDNKTVTQWYSTYNLAKDKGFSVSNCIKDSINKTDGKYALTLMTQDIGSSNVIVGAVTNGTYSGGTSLIFSINNIIPTDWIYGERPTQLNYKYNFTLGNMALDSAVVYVRFLKGSTIIGEAGDSIGINSNGFVTKSMNIIYNSAFTDMPDKYFILVTSGHRKTTDSTRITIDELSFSGLSGVINLESKNNIELTPNPASSEIEINSKIINNKNFTIQVYDIKGGLMTNHSYDRNNLNNKTKLNIEQYPSGLYMVEINDGTNRYHKKFTKF